ncbi:tryptophan--tRNA ligase [Mycoplasma zalophi]|uniref:Tryptophan--tRNA ligase n=1 Tax=Mycoplasma zalophi TaxID=191287 RepID=A0ABS6DP60_9MOLU|nr:tryptophan--tRNA ligase [Mycoplasma zalophi]MBU4691121.1 tryptophan--tRNA ligase [Mycoplasma zalophi]MBU4692105.1 tryptophan--tRNA ligase [Mycoplasma zalophi]
MKRLLSGIKPTGELTLGNYLGALRNFIDLQNNFDAYYFVADLHALTTNDNNPEELKRRRKEAVALYLACGLDPSKCTIFYQSQVYEHGMMQWLLTCETTLGELNRMTQFKDKSQKSMKQGNGTESIPTGLLMYPTLMAGDILLYGAEYVPVGEDQTQHVELTRTIARRVNNKYKTSLVLPEAYIPEAGARIKDLQDPTSKMSKSDKTSKGTIYLLEDPNSAYNKILKAVTDSENKVYISNEKPGVTNLLNIYAGLKNITIQQAEEHFKDKNYKVFKEEVATEVKNLLVDIQSKFKASLDEVEKVTEEGAKKAQLIAKPLLNDLLKKMGF